MWQNTLTLFAQAAATEGTAKVADVVWFKNWWAILLLLVAVIVFSCVFGKTMARKVRMQDYWWKIALILGTVGCAGVIVVTGWPPRYGVDLEGGVTLIYEVEDSEEKIDIGALVQALKKRINPSGVKEIIIRPYGDNKVEIIVPGLDAQEIEALKKQLRAAGVLKFRIVANETDHKGIIDLAKDQLDVVRNVLDTDGETRVGFWADVGLDEKKKDVLQVDVRGETLRYPVTKQIVSPPPELREKTLGKWLIANDYVRIIKGKKFPYIQVLMFTKDEYNVEGKHLSRTSSMFDSRGNPGISFTMTGRGSTLMGGLTGDHLPENNGHTRRLGIILDGTLLSAPTIQGHITTDGQITGSFSKEEVDFIVNILRAGKLPTTLKPYPLSEAQIDAVIGREMREKGIYAIGVSLLAVLVFMVFYYRFSGVVACYALLANIVMIVALVMLVKQPFTLTGLAGLVLIVGMSVDANVLIFERIREELNRGSALRMAIRNGFARATTTIVDANLTTLITALVLYAIGTDQIRGFAVTLILGILLSMFTAIFCSRAIFDIGERKRWITKLRMMRILGETNIDFIGKCRIAAVFSILLIVFGLAAVVMRGKGIFAIDLAGGSSVRMVLNEPLETDEVRKKMADYLKLNDVKVDKAKIDIVVNEVNLKTDGFRRYTVFMIDASIPIQDPDAVKKNQNLPVLADIIREVFKGKLAMYELVEGDSPQVTFSALPSDKPPSDENKKQNNGDTDTSNKTDGPVTGPETPKTPEKA
ncbi:MAG: protein translocase subunit SecD, partial [Planctomycetes bacterium]|nr:protein translocase subunit SecD [Planctomycetota bacterium]